MHKLSYIFLTSIVTAYSGMVFADCAHQQQNIEQQLVQAEKYGNQERIQNLSNSLRNIKRNCSTPTTSTRNFTKASFVNTGSSVSKKELSVQNAYEEFQEAQRIGDSQLISQKREKLRRAQYELSEAKGAL